MHPYHVSIYTLLLLFFYDKTIDVDFGFSFKIKTTVINCGFNFKAKTTIGGYGFAMKK